MLFQGSGTMCNSRKTSEISLVDFMDPSTFFVARNQIHIEEIPISLRIPWLTNVSRHHVTCASSAHYYAVFSFALV